MPNKAMKKLLILFCLLSGALGVYAQKFDRSKRPEAGPAPLIRLGETKHFTLSNGLKVFVVENSKLPRVSFSLVLDNDPVMEGNAVGYVDLTGSMIGTATKTKSKEQIDASIDMLGANFGASANGFFASSLSKHKEKLLEIIGDIIINAEFKQEELDKQIKQTLSGLQTNKDDANAIAENVRRVMVYGTNHPYGEITTEETVGNIKLEMIKNHYDSYFRPNVGYLAVVGDIKFEEAKALIEKHLGGWASKNVPKHSYPQPKAPEGRRVIVVNKPGAVQTVINVTHPIVLQPGSPDAIAASALNNLLGGADARLFNNLRETYGYTYGAYSDISTDKLVGSFNAYAQVRSSVTDSAVTQFLYELDRINNEMVPVDELKGILNYMTGNFARSLERPQTVANFAINTERYGLDKDYYKNYLQQLNAVNSDKIKQVANAYVLSNQAYIICVGDKSEIEAKLGVFASNGKVEVRDMYGREVKAVTPIPVGTTAITVLENYIQAVGGRKNWEQVKDMKLVMSASVQGMNIEQSIIKKLPNKYFTETKMNNSMVLNKVVFDGKKGKQSGMQGNKDLDEEMIAEIKSSSAMLEEVELLKKAETLKLKSIERIDDVEAYLVEVSKANGEKTSYFYDIKSGLKIAESSTNEGPQGPVTTTTRLSDYKEIKGGIKVPYSLSLDMGIQQITMKVTTAEINSKIDDNIFKVD